MQVDPAEVWLQDDCDSTAYFPQEGHFDLHTLGLPYVTLNVEGPDVPTIAPRSSNLPPPPPPRPSSSVTVASTHHSSTLPPPVFRSVTAPRRGATFSLKVVKATILRKGRGKPEFQASSQMYIELTEATAYLDHIVELIRKRWGAEYILVTNDGIELEDSPATQGRRCSDAVLALTLISILHVLKTMYPWNSFSFLSSLSIGRTGLLEESSA